MEIKICGIRRKEDIDIINKYKPDYIGFIFAKSKREVTPETVAEITKNLDKDIKKVGVGFDTVGHGTVGLVQMADGHDIADVTQDDTGQLQLVILHIGSTVKA